MSNQSSIWKLSALVGVTALAGIMACTVTTTDGPNTGDDDDDTTSSSSSSSSGETTSSSSGGSSSGGSSSSSGGEEEECTVPVDTACATCLAEQCVNETAQCFCTSGNPACAQYDDAVASCFEQNPDDEAALEACLEQADTTHAGGIEDYGDWITCLENKCEAACLAE